MWTRRQALRAGAAGGAWAAWPGAGLQAQTAAEPIPAERFFEPPLLHRARLSPDGLKVAMTVSAQADQRARLAVVDLATMASRGVAAITDSHIVRVEWVSDSQLVFDTDMELTGYQRADVGPGLYTVDAEGRTMTQLVDTTGFVEERREGRLLHWRYGLKDLPARPPGDRVLVGRPEEISAQRIGHWHLLWLNVRDRTVREVDLPPDAVDWAFDAQGQLRAVVTRDADRVELRWRDTRADGSGAWRTLQRGQVPGSPVATPLWVDSDGSLLVTAAHQGRDALFRLDPASGERGARPLASHPAFDVHARPLVRDGRLVGLRYTIDAEVTQWLDPALQALQQRIDTLLPGTVNRLTVPQRGRSPWVLVETVSDRQPYRALVFHTETQRLTRLGDSRPRLDPRRMGTTDLHRVAARDGLSLPVWLTLPAGVPPKNLPLVVVVHGGPWVRGASWSFDAEAQFLASRGYTVLQPEFRGSTGYGEALFRAGWKQWGQAMQTDLVDAARWAVAQGTADPSRIAVIGGSYGGYATLMALARDSEVFRAGVAYAAVSDLELLFSLRWSDLTRESREIGLAQLVGDPKTEAALLREHSPLRLASQIRRPLLLAHGEWDARVPMDHAEAMLKALRPHHPALEWVHYKDEGHGWQKPANRIDFWTRVERFLARHLAPLPSSVPSSVPKG
jgi:dipeptidyl aminopeptidase/acylaminoacyl peptidase